ncbi:helix-turn-helix transcriptional regulator [Rhizobium sp. RCC_161_2]|uniref:helix-turn-helix transcriptional regulator n=1 Tax=Rhizobium sp. RCC_161_2 TaxID=3239219 RepID=UPI003524A2D3
MLDNLGKTHHICGLGLSHDNQDLTGIARRPALYQQEATMLNEALRLIRVFHDIKQSEAAYKLGISKSYLSEIEKGRKAPSLDLLRKYEATFDIPASSIMFFSENLGKSAVKEKARTLVASKIISIMKFMEERSERTNEQ